MVGCQDAGSERDSCGSGVVFGPFGEWDAAHIEEVGGAGVPAGAVHAADEVEIGSIDVVFGGIEDKFVADVCGEDFAEDEPGFGADVDDLKKFAFESGGTFGNARRLDEGGRRGGEAGLLEFVGARGEIYGGDVHAFGDFLGDEVDDELAGVADVVAGVFGAAGFVTADADTDDGGITAEGVEEGEGRGVEMAVGVLADDPGYGPGNNGGEENFVAFLWRESLKVEEHEKSSGHSMIRENKLVRAEVWTMGGVKGLLFTPV